MPVVAGTGHQAGARGGLTRLAGLLVLAFAVLSMHALGHMVPGGGGGMRPAAVAMAAGHGAGPAAGYRASPSPGRGGGRSHHGMPRADPMNVCLAVLGAFGLFMACLPLPRQARTGASPVTGGPPRGWRARHRPPCPPRFAGLPVLRI
jgi:hypothetical protein